VIVDNLVHFARVLRRAGLQVGPDRVLSAIAAVQAVGVERREDLHAALSAVMLDRHEQQAIFDAAFDAFFRDPKLLERAAAAGLDVVGTTPAQFAASMRSDYEKWNRRIRELNIKVE
jgi:uncharacterized protein with von Willebrand factor type A (vWA) domain